MKISEQLRKNILPEGALGKVFVMLDSSDQPEGPMSLTAWIRNLYMVKGDRFRTV